MNWKQLYTSATPQEREAMLLSMLRTIEARQNKLVVISPLSKSALDLGRGRGWGLIHERRGPFAGAHFLNDRRRRLIPRPLFLASFMVILTAVSLAVWISFFFIPPVYAAPLMLFHLTALITLLAVKPYKPRLSHALSHE
jgi:hypothetical protein